MSVSLHVHRVERKVSYGSDFYWIVFDQGHLSTPLLVLEDFEMKRLLQRIREEQAEWDALAEKPKRRRKVKEVAAS